MPGEGTPQGLLSDEPGALMPGVGPMKPEQHGRFFSKWWPQAAPDSDFLMDVEAKKRNATGIPNRAAAGRRGDPQHGRHHGSYA